MGADPDTHRTWFDWLVYAVIPITTFVIGFFVSRFTMTKKESKDYQSARLDRSNTLSEGRRRTFEEFAAALAEYNQRLGDPTHADFYKISTSGESYFSQMRMICDAILADNLDPTAVLNSHVPAVRDLVEKILPAFFDTLRDIAERNDIQYHGVLRRSDYESVFRVYEQYIGKWQTADPTRNE